MSIVNEPPVLFYLPAVDRSANVVASGLQWPSWSLQNLARSVEPVSSPKPAARLPTPEKATVNPSGTTATTSPPPKAGGGSLPPRLQPQFQPRDPDNPFDGGTDHGDGGGGGGGNNRAQ